MSGFYKIGKESLLARLIPAEAGVYAVGVNEDYTYDAAHTDPAIFAGNILLPEKQLTGVGFTDGVLTADESSWAAAGAGVSDRSLVLKGVIIYFMLADEGALLAYIDSAAVGLPQVVTGANVKAKWPQGILQL